MSRRVTVFRGAESEGYPFLAEPYRIDVISCVAPPHPELQRGPSRKWGLAPRRYEAMEVKIRGILSAAHRAGSEALVLTAFGCGAFRNPPADVAEIFRNLIAREFRRAFRHISFSILENRKNSWYSHHGNLRPFVEAFQALDKEEYAALRGSQGSSSDEPADPSASASTSGPVSVPASGGLRCELLQRIIIPAAPDEQQNPEDRPKKPKKPGEARRRRSYHRSKADRKQPVPCQ